MPSNYAKMRSRVRKVAKKPSNRTYASKSKQQRWRSLITNTKPAFGYNLGARLHIDKVAPNRGAFPTEMYIKFRYTDVLTLSADNLTGLTGSEIPYRLNSLFDPYFLTGGHQPLGFDQMSPIYQNYTVYKVDVQIRVLASVGTGEPFLAVNVKPSTSVYTLSGLKNAGEILEQPNNTILDGDDSRQCWNTTIDLSEIEGISKRKIMTENNYSAAVTANPTSTPFLGLACGTYLLPASSTNSVICAVSFVFHTRMWAQNPLAQS